MYKIKLNHPHYSILAIALATAIHPAWAAPPREAIDACNGLAENTACSIRTPDGNTLSGVCAMLESTLACVPGDGPPPSDDGTTGLPDNSANPGNAERFARFDPAGNALHLPHTDAGPLGGFDVTLRLSGVDPITFDLDLATLAPIALSGQADAVYDPAGGTLTIPAVQVDTDSYSAQMRLVPMPGGLRFELTGIAPAQAPDDATGSAGAYPIVDTNQAVLFDATNGTFSSLQSGQAFFGQDANYLGNQPAYTDNGDGTVTDNVTGLMWQKTPDFNGDGGIDVNDKKTLDNALADAASFDLAGYDDWRLPTIKELYSLMDFSGTTGTGNQSGDGAPADAVPYLDTDYFDFAYGDGAAGERYIDAQYWSSTIYGSTTMGGNPTAFGVNFADGRIKGYPYANQREQNGRFIRYVRGNPDYGHNAFVDNGDGTIHDAATGLTWMRDDSGAFGAGPFDDGSMNWEQALAWCEDLSYAGYDDWRLPDAKELQSLVDYNRAPDTTDSPAIDPLFNTTLLPDGINSSGQTNYPFFWSGTTHVENGSGQFAAYIAFGEARGYLNGQLDDVHGAGAQRSDPKSGDPSPYTGVGHGPQGDVVSIYNFARCVRGGVAVLNTEGAEANFPPGGGTGATDDTSPPPEAITACAGLNQGNRCTVQTPQGSLAGTCGMTPDNSLACMPR